MRATVEKVNNTPELGIGTVPLSTLADAMNSPRRLKVLRQVFANLLLAFPGKGVMFGVGFSVGCPSLRAACWACSGLVSSTGFAPLSVAGSPDGRVISGGAIRVEATRDRRSWWILEGHFVSQS